MMREMKDSGIEWIGTIPNDWSIIRLKNCVDILSGFPFESAQFTNVPGFPLIRIRDITSGSIETYYNGEYEDNYIVHNGDLLVGMDGDFNVRWWELQDALLNQRCCKISASPIIDKRYLFYCLPLLLKRLNDLTYSTTVKHLSVPDIRESWVPCIPQNEQKRISAFLDSVCSHIDSAIDQTRASIEEYKKLKQSIITQAVTKGIRPNRKMKDSGDEWLGDIPIEWSCKKFKYIATVKSNLVAPDEYGDYPQVSPENIEKGSGRLLPCRTVAEVGVISWNHLFYKGQILYSKIRPKLNKVVIAPFDGLCSADMYPIETRLNERFFLYSMQSNAFLANIGLITEDRVKMPKINQEELGEIRFAVPPDDEQLEIVAHLDRRAAEIDGIITNKEQLMMELESYKKSLIYEYVTGKKEVV